MQGGFRQTPRRVPKMRQASVRSTTSRVFFESCGEAFSPSSAACARCCRCESNRLQDFKRSQQARRKRRIERIDRLGQIRQKLIPRSVGGVEGARIAHRKRGSERAHAIGIADIEVGMLAQLDDAGERIAARRRRLHRKPFVDHQRVLAPALVELLKRFIEGVAVGLAERVEGGGRFGHAGGVLEGAAEHFRLLGSERGEQVERRALERPAPGGVGARREGLFALGAGDRLQACAVGACYGFAQALTSGIKFFRIGRRRGQESIR